MPQLLNKSLKNILRLLLILFYPGLKGNFITELGVARAEREYRILENF